MQAIISGSLVVLASFPPVSVITAWWFGLI